MRIKKLLLIVIGLFVLLLGMVGMFLPVLPTTPFILLAAACFSASSPRLSSILRRNKYFGSYIDNYQYNSGIPKKVKIRSIIFLWSGLILSMILINKIIMYVILVLIGLGVTLHLILLKTK
jgi:uncharacterized protein